MKGVRFAVEHIGLSARDTAALKDWYVRVLGAVVRLELPQTPPAYLLALPGGLVLEIYSAKSWQEATSNNGLAGWRHLALRVDHLESAWEELRGQGVALEDEIKPAGGGGRVLFLRDLEGNLLHLVERPSPWMLDPIAQT